MTPGDLKTELRKAHEALEEYRNEARHLDAALKLERENYTADRSRWDERAERYKAQIVKLKSELVKANSRVRAVA